ncbi:MAG: hypothetical protein ACJ0Q8_10880 [Candidatus Azotimanducaceae bacterium]
MTDGFQLAGYTVTQILRESATELAVLGYQQALNKRCFIRAVRAPASLGFWQTEVDVLKGIASPKLLQLIDHGQQGEWHYSAVEYVSQGTPNGPLATRTFSEAIDAHDQSRGGGLTTLT